VFPKEIPTMKNLVLLFAFAVLGITAYSHDLRADYIVTGDVDLYKQPGGKGKPIGIVRGSKTKIYPTINCRSDRWCQIPDKGWVWGNFIKEVAAGTTAGQSAPTGGGGIKPIDEKPADTLLLPYFECDLSKGEPCDVKPK
jgi:hypothetical protein